VAYHPVRSLPFARTAAQTTDRHHGPLVTVGVGSPRLDSFQQVDLWGLTGDDALHGARSLTSRRARSPLVSSISLEEIHQVALSRLR
jgi:hypothetical protein